MLQESRLRIAFPERDGVPVLELEPYGVLLDARHAPHLPVHQPGALVVSRDLETMAVVYSVTCGRRLASIVAAGL